MGTPGTSNGTAAAAGGATSPAPPAPPETPGTAGAASADPGAPIATGGTSSQSEPSTGGSASSTEAPPSDDEIYDPALLPRFDLDVPEPSWRALSGLTADDPARLEYVRATLRYGDHVIQDVGLRLKGEGSWRPVTEKAAWKVKLDEFVANQTLLGLKRLTFNNMVEDPSFLAERLAFHVFRAAGLPAPRCNSAVVYVNGEYYGVYANLEAEDKAFLRRWFDDDDGNLYEEGQVDFLQGNAAAFDLETNEQENDRSDLEALIDAIDAVGPSVPWRSLDAVLDTDHFLRFTAVEAAVNQWDMYAYTRFWPNNFRIYFDPTTSRFTFLPWGMDLSMKPFRDSGKPHIELFEVSRQGDRPQGQVVAGILFRKCLDDDTCPARLAQAALDAADVYEGLDLEPLAETLHSQIHDAVEDDPRREYTMTQFDAAHEALLETIRTRAEALRGDATR